MSVPKFAASRSFHTELKSRINAYFEEAGKSQTGNSGLFVKALILTTAFVLVYLHLVFFTPNAFLGILECILLGGIGAAIGFNVMHDGAHGSFSKSKWLNQFAAFTLNVLGGNSFMWNMKHNLIHHMYTNVDGVDDDLDVQPWMRMSSTQPRRKLHRFQHLYFWFLYALLYIAWIFFMDYQKYFKGKIGAMPIKKMTATDQSVFWGFKVIHLLLFMALPIYTVGFVSWLVGFVIFAAVAGFTLSLVFQLAHTVEHAAFPMPDEITNKLEDEWAIHQIKTTANFATHNKVISWLVGGLNFQVEHHLFPKISHVHYPAISKIIKQMCEEFDITYNEYPKMRYAVASHVSHLRELGRK
ncbi:Linoleoyl-CoA desaturase [Hymenobacter roseosalivarius DSM 11622]|uniref:Linoleoyl-CoA desaturase n=1 Tax=Hymenobacter roseosalivarius DSM 11622 TaxID=645990 RepID=A0A1W1VW51_9BACT|nr:acyl-CoA desaturase [Hymenobacter roseosalivarius]SMB97602.1 Linoleoyl-CoA desaturase [Hymenobacter roseosalivarius DSM 11622]